MQIQIGHYAVVELREEQYVPKTTNPNAEEIALMRKNMELFQQCLTMIDAKLAEGRES